MSLAKVVASTPDRVAMCKLAQRRQELPDEERAALDTMLADAERWPTRALWKILRSEHVDVGRTVLQEHRSGMCRCVTE